MPGLQVKCCEKEGIQVNKRKQQTRVNLLWAKQLYYVVI